MQLFRKCEGTLEVSPSRTATSQLSDDLATQRPAGSDIFPGGGRLCFSEPRFYIA